MFGGAASSAEARCFSCSVLKEASLGGKARHARLGFHSLFTMKNVHGIARAHQNDIPMIPIVKVLKIFGRRNVCPTQPLPELFLFTLTTILKSKPILDFACLGATRLVYILLIIGTTRKQWALKQTDSVVDRRLLLLGWARGFIAKPKRFR